MHLFTPFFATSRIGFGICDTQLRYQAINSALAATNQRPAEAHLGSTVREVLGEVATKIESAFERVLDTQKPVLKEISGKIPTREDTVHWIANYFPVKDSGGKVRGLGAIVVKITEQKALENSLRFWVRNYCRPRSRNNNGLQMSCMHRLFGITRRSRQT
jgi:PAS domain-containing protein